MWWLCFCLLVFFRWLLWYYVLGVKCPSVVRFLTLTNFSKYDLRTWIHTCTIYWSNRLSSSQLVYIWWHSKRKTWKALDDVWEWKKGVINSSCFYSSLWMHSNMFSKPFHLSWEIQCYHISFSFFTRAMSDSSDTTVQVSCHVSVNTVQFCKIRVP